MLLEQSKSQIKVQQTRSQARSYVDISWDIRQSYHCTNLSQMTDAERHDRDGGEEVKDQSDSVRRRGGDGHVPGRFCDHQIEEVAAMNI